MNLGGLICLGLGAVLMQLQSEDYQRFLDAIRRAMVKAGLRDKEVMYACGVTDPAQFSKMLSGQKRLPLDVYAAMPLEVRQHVALEELDRLGLPRSVRVGVAVTQRIQERRRA